jgi:Uma2 family endonuclease
MHYRTRSLPAHQPNHPIPLRSGDRLSRSEFLRRYSAQPVSVRAELIEGVAYVAPPTHFEQHGRLHSDILTWLGVYRAATPGVLAAANAAVRLDLENEVQPDALLRLGSVLGGRSYITAEDFLEGAPELIVEIAPSNAAYDLHDKRRVYARNGVQEYLAVQVHERRIDWFVLHEDGYQTRKLDSKGVLRSEVFPGLWLYPPALWAGDIAALLAVLNEGIATPEHAACVDRLQEKQASFFG